MLEENITLSGETQGVADPVNDVSETSEAMTEEATQAESPDTSGETQEVAEPESTGKTSADTAFANMRRELQRAQAELQQSRGQLNRMSGVLNQFGFTGETPDIVADNAYAHITGQDVNTIRQDREDFLRQQQEQERLQSELDYYRNIEIQRRIDSDLKAIQKVDPKVKSLNELGEQYFKLIQSGVDGLTAYFAVKGASSQGEKKAPPKVGAVNAKTAEERDYYTSDELDALTSKDLDNPKIYEKAMRSMARLK